MSYTKHYSGSKATKDRQALDDCLTWFGPDGYRSVSRKVEAFLLESIEWNRQQGLSPFAIRQGMRTAILSLAFTGIQGYPARAFTRKCLRRLHARSKP